MAVVLILVDALRTDFLTKDKMPFLFSKLESSLYVEKVIPSFGFCERTEIFTGMYPQTSGNFAAIGYDPEKSEYRKYNDLLNSVCTAIEFLGVEHKVSRGIRKIMNRFFQMSGIKMSSYNIPLNSLPKFRLTEDANSHYDIQAFVKESIFDVMKKEGKKCYVESFTALGRSAFNTDLERINAVIRSASMDYDLVLLYISEIDTLGHQHITDLEVMNKALLSVDKAIEEVWKAYYSSDPTFKLVILGDHGMVPVTDYVNILSECALMPIRKGKDYEMFLDSTQARFWFFNHKAEKQVNQMLQREHISTKGFILDNKKILKYKVPLDFKNNEGSSLYGDLIWSANSGVLINPDYFNSGKEITGMHGYADMKNEGKGLLVIPNYNPSINIEQCNLVDICPTLCKMLKIPIPNGNEGLPLI